MRRALGACCASYNCWLAVQTTALLSHPSRFATRDLSPQSTTNELTSSSQTSTQSLDSFLGACEDLVVAAREARGGRADAATVDAKFNRILADRDKFNVLMFEGDAAGSSSNALILLSALADAATALARRRHEHFANNPLFGATTTKHRSQSSTALTSPYMDDDASDHVSALLTAVAHRLGPRAPPSEVFELMNIAARLEIGDVDTLSFLSRQLLSRHSVKQMSATDLVQSLHIVTLCVKRRGIPIPNLEACMVSLVSNAKGLSIQDSLVALSSILRVRKDRQCIDALKILTSRVAAKISAARFPSALHADRGSRPSACDNDEFDVGGRTQQKAVALLSGNDVVFGLRIAAFTHGCSIDFVEVVLLECADLSPTLSPKQLGDVCKALRAIHVSRDRGHLTRTTCGRVTRRLVPQLVKRAEALLGQFSLRDARCVLELFETFQVKHSMVFAQLTPFISAG